MSVASVQPPVCISGQHHNPSLTPGNHTRPRARGHGGVGGKPLLADRGRGRVSEVDELVCFSCLATSITDMWMNGCVLATLQHSSPPCGWTGVFGVCFRLPCNTHHWHVDELVCFKLPSNAYHWHVDVLMCFRLSFNTHHWYVDRAGVFHATLQHSLLT